MSERLKLNAIKYIQKEFKTATVYSHKYFFSNDKGEETFKYYPIIGHDYNSGTKHYLIAVQNLGRNRIELNTLVSTFKEQLEKTPDKLKVILTSSVGFPDLKIEDFPNSLILTLYTDNLCCEAKTVIDAFEAVNTKIKIIEQNKMYKSASVSGFYV